MIRIQNLWKTYGTHPILKGLTLEVKKGEILVILGRSGVGKSVLLRHIIGIEEPDQGTIEVDGVDLSLSPLDQREEILTNMGMLFQGSALFDSMTIEENTAFWLQQHKNPIDGNPFSEKEIRRRVKEALSMVGLDGVENKMPSDLSGGMRKRAGLARLIVYRPSILLYDEPTTGLDPITAEQINELIVKTQNELKGTSIVVTHDLHSALFMADKLALHQEGVITHLADPETFLTIPDPTIAFFKQHLKKRQIPHG